MPTGKVTITGQGEGRDVFHFLTERRLVVVIETDRAEWRGVYRGLVVQLESARLESYKDVTHGNGCRCIVALC